MAAFTDTEGLKRDYPEVYSFIKTTDLQALSEGRIDITSELYANVESYRTFCRNERRYESHKKYIDIQFVVSGRENIEVNDIDKLTITQKYDKASDATFYSNGIQGRVYTVEANQCLIIQPQDGHMPCLSVDGIAEKVKKIVFKVPVEAVKKQQVQYLVMDVDGTLTNGKIYMAPSGEAMKAFDIKDGYAINNILRGSNIRPVIITGRDSQIVSNRCKELNIKDVYQGVADKSAKIKEIFSDLSRVAVIGDDIPDLDMMKPVKEAGGLIGCPADAVREVKDIADFVASHDGGNGAVRDFIDWLVQG